jgi:hypothetical protein
MGKFRMGFLAFAACALASSTGLAQPDNLSNWNTLAEGGAGVDIAQVAATPPLLEGQGTNALQVTVKQSGERFGIVCAGMGKIKLQTDEWYDVSFNARTDARKTYALTISLESQDGKKVAARTTLPEVGKVDWARYSVALHVHQPVSKCRMVIEMDDTGSIALNDISVVLRKTDAPK